MHPIQGKRMHLILGKRHEIVTTVRWGSEFVQGGGVVGLAVECAPLCVTKEWFHPWGHRFLEPVAGQVARGAAFRECLLYGCLWTPSPVKKQNSKVQLLIHNWVISNFHQQSKNPIKRKSVSVLGNQPVAKDMTDICKLDISGKRLLISNWFPPAFLRLCHPFDYCTKNKRLQARPWFLYRHQHQCNLPKIFVVSPACVPVPSSPVVAPCTCRASECSPESTASS